MDVQHDADRERMKTLLVEAIATLCRNGLHYKEELSVEGLIGITVDKSDVFLVSVRETFCVAPKHKNKQEMGTSQNVGSPKRGPKRSGGIHDGAPSEKHKRKGEPKQLSAEEVEMINNSPAGGHDVSLDTANEDSVSGSDTGHSERLRTGGTYQSEVNYLDQSDHRTRKKPEDDIDDDDDDIVFIDPDLAIKQEKVKGENGQNACMYDSNQSVFNDSPQTVSRPPPPLHPRPLNQPDPRTSHPSGLNSDQLALAYATPVKQEQNMDVIRMSGSINKFGPEQSPVSMVPSTSAGGTLAQPLDGLGDMQAYPVDWANQSAQEFISMPGDESSQLSPSQQASGSGGASQQELRPVPIMATDGALKYGCPKGCSIYKNKCSAFRHISARHANKYYKCQNCGSGFSRAENLLRHQRLAFCSGNKLSVPLNIFKPL